VASCGTGYEPEPVTSITFPHERLEERGFYFAKASEWMVITRELAQYATGSELEDFRRLVSMHSASDEMFWATMVLNIPNFTQTISPQGWFMTWTKDCWP